MVQWMLHPILDFRRHSVSQASDVSCRKVFLNKKLPLHFIFMDWACLKTALACQLEGGRLIFIFHWWAKFKISPQERPSPLSSGWWLGPRAVFFPNVHSRASFKVSIWSLSCTKLILVKNWNIIHSFELASQSDKVQKCTLKQGKFKNWQQCKSSKRKHSSDERRIEVIWQLLYLFKLC